ncbi:MAG: fructose-6-phosphate aldolase [Alphaproteobacteria bacterium]|nr:fructose-6-phosphate aldolase [Alphaproteobacteria bacterium]
MKIFLDTADIAQIEALLDTGMIDGVTTNPSLIAKSGGDIKQTIAKICDLVDGPVSAEVTATDVDTMMAEADVLSAIAPQVAVKVPLTKEGLIVCRRLSERDIMVNVTLCFSAGQALLAAKAGASFISPFVGRLDDLGADGMNLIADICTIYDHYDFNTQILVASARNPQHVVDAALLGADVITLPPAIIDQLYKHPLTDKGLSAFLEEWKKTGQSIL